MTAMKTRQSKKKRACGKQITNSHYPQHRDTCLKCFIANNNEIIEELEYTIQVADEKAEAQEKKIQELEKQIDSLNIKTSLQNMDKQIQQLKKNLDDFKFKEPEPKNRRREDPKPLQDPTRELTIKNIPYKKEEDLKKMIKNLADTKQVQLGDFKCFRALKKGGGNADENRQTHPRIIIILPDNETKNALKKRHREPLTLRALGLEDQKETEIYIEENLTREQGHLFWKVRTFKKKNEYEFAWVKDGVCFLKKSPEEQIHRIDDEEQLERLSKA